MIEKIITPDDDLPLLSELQIASTQESKAGRARKSEHQIWDDPNVKLIGWKFNEWDYSKEKVDLPTNARGLFYLNNKIVVRGYDKFFNIGEVRTTSWNWIEENTCGPYYLTIKENGCIVFLSGLEDGTLIVTSKHSTGPREDSPNDTNHSWVARNWVENHLRKAGKTRYQLAKELYSLNATAVGELCDDSFEEHILPYEVDKSGIYLHGLNANSRKFVTYPFQAVEELGEKYGFMKTKYFTKPDCSSLKNFLSECSETGSWGDKDIEGFVIRCKVKNSGDDLFFKYKFEEPYLMYREWREATKAYLRSPDTVLANIKNNKKITLEYLKFIKPILDNNPSIRENFLRNHGIIALRERFLKSKGQTAMELVKEEEKSKSSNCKYALIPAATIGCGKTTLGLALCYLTGFGILQNDNYYMKGAKQKLVNDTCEAFKTNEVMFIDRNNHMIRERKQIIEDVLSMSFDEIKFICLNFLPNGSSESIFKFTRDRVSDRGDNHQTITGLTNDKIDVIMRGFINRFQRVNPSHPPDSWFDEIIDLDVPSGTKENLKRVLKVLKEKYGLVGEFSEDQLDEALRIALEYKPDREGGKNTKNEKNKKVVKPIEKKVSLPPKPLHTTYYSLVVSLDSQSMIEIIDNFFSANLKADVTYWKKLKQNSRVQKSFHVTLVHYKQLEDPEKKECFDKLEAIAQQSGIVKPTEGSPIILRIPNHSSKIRIISIGHDATVMALKVQIISSEIPFANDICHITIGTSLGVNAVKSLDMLASPESKIYDWNIEPFEIDGELGVFMGEKVNEQS